MHGRSGISALGMPESGRYISGTLPYSRARDVVILYGTAAPRKICSVSQNLPHSPWLKGERLHHEASQAAAQPTAH
jgi:hypothetical protein